MAQVLPFLRITYISSGTKIEHKPKLLSPDLFRWDRGLPCEGVEAKKFGMSLEIREIKLFGRDIPGFFWDIPAVPEKMRKIKFVFNFCQGNPNGGLANGGLARKANWAKKGPFGAISALPPWLWGAEELVPIGPEKAPIGPEKAPICPEKARFSRKDFPLIFSEESGA